MNGCLMNNKTFIIAEIGINFNGSLENCYKLIDSAADAGCDCVKFQLFSASGLYPVSAGKLDWKDSEKEYSYDIYEAVRKFELPAEWLDGIIQYCGLKKIEFSSSAFDISGACLLYEKGIKSYKISSNSITNIPLLEYCAAKMLPLYISTGGARIGEVEDAVDAVLKYHDKIFLMHCSLKYPTALEECNLGVIETLKYAFPGFKTGYSDHTMEVYDAPVQSVYLGARVIEKHITLDKKMPGPDQFFALEPDELKQMVSQVREAEKDLAKGSYKIDRRLYGCCARKTYEHERYIRDFSYMCCFAGRIIKKGERILPEDLTILRPGKKKRGLEPKYLRLFAENSVLAKRDIGFEDPVDWGCIL